MKKVLEKVCLYDGRNYFGEPCRVVIESGRISSITPLGEAALKDAPLWTPAWIDVHSHSDVSALAAPECFSKASGGIGVEIVGNCGLSAFPLTGNNSAHIKKLYENYGVALNWHDCSGYIAALAAAGTANRIYSLVGHNTLRAAVMGYERRSPDDSDLSAMVKLLERELEQGALGLSTGLLYVPGRFAGKDELAALLRSVARRDGIYATHLRNEGDGLLEAVSEAVELCRVSGLGKLHISHLKTSGERNWPKLDAVFGLLAGAERDGISVTFDRYAYCCSMTQLSVAAPGPYQDMSDRAIEEHLRNSPGGMAGIIEALNTHTESYWEKTILVNSKLEKYRGYLGLPVAGIAASLRVSAPELVAEILREDSVGATAAFSSMCRRNLVRIAADRRCLCGSDESARPLNYSLGRSHIRNFGNSARFFNLVKAECGLAAAVRRMSGDAAGRFGLADYGFFAPGKLAEFTVVEPSKFADRAVFSAPHTPSDGVELHRFRLD